MIVHAFINRGTWMLAKHLAVYSSFCDRIICVTDRSPESVEVCKRFPKVECHEFHNTHDFPADFNGHGIICDEGAMRQVAFDLAAQLNPEFIVFGDTDELPTPDIRDWFNTAEPNVLLWYADWVNLVHDEQHAIGGTRSPWSFQAKGSNKKALILRYWPDRIYQYARRFQHVRMEPSPLNEGKAVINETHKLLTSPKLLHYKYADWERWQRDPLSQVTGQYKHLLHEAEIVDVPKEWLWG